MFPKLGISRITATKRRKKAEVRGRRKKKLCIVDLYNPLLAFSQQKHKDKSDRRDSAEGNNKGRSTRVYSPETEGDTEDERQTAAASLNSSSLCCGTPHIKGGHTATKTSICKCVVESRSCKMCLHGEMSDALWFRKAMAVEKIALFVTLP